MLFLANSPPLVLIQGTEHISLAQSALSSGGSRLNSACPSRRGVHNGPVPLGLCGEECDFHGCGGLCLLPAESPYPVPLLPRPLVRPWLPERFHTNRDDSYALAITWPLSIHIYLHIADIEVSLVLVLSLVFVAVLDGIIFFLILVYIIILQLNAS